MSKGKVIVAMSGGVDSSVAAALLKKEGYEVIGITMQIWPFNSLAEEAERFGGCCSLTAVEDARKVAYELGVPHYVLNFREIFAEKVIANFCEEYQQGRTPNPCIRCNEHIKFKALRRKVRGLDVDFVATGHYARVEYDSQKEKYLLMRGKDLLKDQSYVLYMMDQEQLEHTLMPLGEFSKSETRKIAAKLGLKVAYKKESQEICFIPDKDYGQFLRESIPEVAKPGPILDRRGRVLGKHQGVAFHTVGQRKGLGIAAKKPLYVIEIDSKNNTLVVGPEEETYGDELIAKRINWIAGNGRQRSFEARAKIRYGMREAPAQIFPLDDGRVRVKFDQPQRGITPGQAVVFYDGDVVVGGGTIC